MNAETLRLSDAPSGREPIRFTARTAAAKAANVAPTRPHRAQARQRRGIVNLRSRHARKADGR